MDRDYCPECDQYVVASVLAEYGRCLGCVERHEQEARREYYSHVRADWVCSRCDKVTDDCQCGD